VTRGRSFSFRDRVVVISGGSRGLGLVLARELADEGARLLLLARDQDELSRAEHELRARGAAVATLTCDVGHSAQAQSAIVHAVETYGGLDVLINNAGIIQAGPLDHMGEEDFEQCMAVHFWGPLHLMLAALPHLRRRGGGRILNIASIGGRLAFPHLLPYTASKFALVGLSEGLHHELRREGIFVTTVCPGLMRTGSHLRALFKGRHEREFGWFALASATPVLSMAVRRAARKIIAACRRGEADLVLTAPARLGVTAHALAPEAMALALSLVARLLPKAGRRPHGDRARPGFASRPRWLPRLLTALADRASARNNELPV
jgi:NAD(P)-dependent dehydrogenase (short-subunit alcohol dehydrogenase family)